MTKQRVITAVAGVLVGGFWAWTAQAETKVSQEIEVGLQDVNINNPEAKFEEYKDIPQGIVFPRYKLDVEAPTYELSLDAKKVTQEDQSFDLSYDRNGKLSFTAGWDQTPHRWSNTSRTLYNETSPGVYEIPDNIQADLQTSTTTAYWWSKMPGYLAGAHEQDLMVRRDKLSAGIGGTLTESIGLSFNFSQEKKFGNQLTPLALGRNYLTELARSVDETVYDSVVSFNYSQKATTVGLTYGLNLYENEKDSITWDNSKKNTDWFVNGNTHTGAGTASKQGRAAMQPDNLAHNARLNVGFDLSSHSRFTADVRYTRMEQNETLLPYSINSSMTFTSNGVTNIKADDPSVLPSQDAETAMDLWVQDYQLINRFKVFSYGVKARSEQLASKSKEITFAGHTVLDQEWNTTPEETSRFSYRKHGLTGYMDWTVLRPLTLGVDYTKDFAHRTHREYTETTEDSWVGRLNYTPVSWVQMRGRYNNAYRNAKEFEIHDYMSNATTFNENPGIRRFDIGERVRNAGDLKVDAWKGPVTLSLNGGLGHDKYKPGEENLSNPRVAISTSNQNKQYGLLENRVANAGVDLYCSLTGGIGISTFYQYSQVRGVQRQNQNTTPGNSPVVNQDTAYDYTLNTNDRYDVVGVGLDTPPILSTTFHLGYDLAYSRGVMEYSELGSALAAKKSVPETVSSKQDYSIRGEYKATKSLSLSLGYLFELYNIKDFAQDNVPLATGQAVSQTNVNLGDSSLDYKAHVITFLTKYKF
ncbi:MAG: MtrB/PioB family outer membrane beta-barrel protein [Elusimicrobia bacterium]|nr:MtrB/PioB family outer membrane beta-barrel protein [Elusimicrobiota bacterium]